MVSEEKKNTLNKVEEGAGMEKQRQTELDILRFFALLFVIALHVMSSAWGKLPIMSSDWIQTAA